MPARCSSTAGQCEPAAPCRRVDTSPWLLLRNADDVGMVLIPTVLGADLSGCRTITEARNRAAILGSSAPARARERQYGMCRHVERVAVVGSLGPPAPKCRRRRRLVA